MTNALLRLMSKQQSSNYNLICLPFAGGYAEYYLPWRNALPSQMQLCPLQLPGRSYRWKEPVIDNVQDLLHDMLPDLIDLLQDKPYVLFGHSMGGYIAYECCKYMIQEKIPLPSLLVVSSLPAPIYWQQRKLLSELNEEEFKSFFLKLGGFRRELLAHESFIKMQMALLRSDIMLCESCIYTSAGNFPFPILALGGKNDDYVSIGSMTKWQQETTSHFALHAFHGEHFYLNEHLSSVIGLIKKWMVHNDNLQ